MRIRLLLSLYSHNNGGWILPIKPLIFEPEWRSVSKPYRNTAPIVDPIMKPVPFGETTEVVIQPKAPEFWKAINVGDELFCCDNTIVLGSGTVIEIATDRSNENAA